MQEATCTIEPVEANRLLVRLRGVLEDHVVDRLSDDLLPRVRELGAQGELIIDMQELDSCTTEGRLRLIELQRGIAQAGARTAFVADRPRFRGIGLFVAHTSGDPNARSFHFLPQAQAWLSTDEKRLVSITSYLDRARRSPRKSEPERPSSKELRKRLERLRSSSDEEGPR